MEKLINSNKILRVFLVAKIIGAVVSLLAFAFAISFFVKAIPAHRAFAQEVETRMAQIPSFEEHVQMKEEVERTYEEGYAQFQETWAQLGALREARLGQ